MSFFYEVMLKNFNFLNFDKKTQIKISPLPILDINQKMF